MSSPSLRGFVNTGPGLLCLDIPGKRCPLNSGSSARHKTISPLSYSLGSQKQVFGTLDWGKVTHHTSRIFTEPTSLILHILMTSYDVINTSSPWWHHCLTCDLVLTSHLTRTPSGGRPDLGGEWGEFTRGHQWKVGSTIKKQQLSLHWKNTKKTSEICVDVVKTLTFLFFCYCFITEQ